MMQMPQEKIDHDLVQALEDYLTGVPGAAERLCRCLQPKLLPIARTILSSSVWDPEDAVNTSLVAILKFLADRGWYDGGLAGFISFCNRVVRNRCLDIQRWEKRHPTSSMAGIDKPDEGGFMDPLDKLINDEVRENLKSAFAQLEPECRGLLVSIFYHQKSMEELRETFGLKSVQALYYRRDRCLQKLRKIFKTIT